MKSKSEVTGTRPVIHSLRTQAAAKGLDLRIADTLAWQQLVRQLPALAGVEEFIRTRKPERESLEFWQTLNTAKNQLRRILEGRPGLNSQANWEVCTARVTKVLREVSR